ncbi:hypothetical protein FH608_038490 [Nonomuraea phyllanthi]|uniref:Uncharacterized protein n=1 Tax=Nonomuraea phyllanthi TaxID=2219224 RepID=A0A5C4VQU4_9ACTN|nr:hypothetical protein [Nonomuraea phyllanthi]KAB8189884.1 hypothetical protein FH608_038490 [Nonomuraea phyllanthi]
MYGTVSLALAATLIPAASEDEAAGPDGVRARPTATPAATPTPTPTPTPTLSATPSATPTPEPSTPAPSESATPEPSTRDLVGELFRDGVDEAGRCNPHVFFKVHRLSPRNFFLPRTRYIDGPGGTMTVSVTREHEIRAFLETENERQWSITHKFTTKDLVRQFRKMGIPHLEERHMVYTGHEYTREVSKGKYGNMWYRVFGYRIGWSAWSQLGTCRDVRVARGIANVPARVEGWRYWETDRPMFKGRPISDK